MTERSFENFLGWENNLHPYKGNLHSHTVHSDGHLLPEESAELYKKNGWNFLCLSEHDRYTDCSRELNSDGFIVIPALEASAILTDGKLHAVKLHHMNGILGTDSMKEKAVQHFHNMECLPPLVTSDKTVFHSYAEKLSNTLKEHGCLVTYNHPIWSRVEPEDLEHMDAVSMIEIYNYDTVQECATGADTVFWDMMLRGGRRINAFASDDNHNNGMFEDSCGGWVTVMASELNQNAIAEALIDGSYYSSTGPEIHDWGIHDDVCYINCSPSKKISFIMGGPVGYGNSINAEERLLEHAEIKLQKYTQYVRIECTDSEGKTAWTNAVFPSLRKN
jgi:predicted metal-dependent phosphoesterase TrpH